MAQTATKLEALRERQARLKARIEKLENESKKQSRKDRTRLMILIGAAMLADSESHRETAQFITLQTLPAREEAGDQQGDHHGAAEAGGFSLHAGIDIAPGQRAKLERLCRYVSRPPVTLERMALTASGHGATC